MIFVFHKYYKPSILFLKVKQINFCRIVPVKVLQLCKLISGVVSFLIFFTLQIILKSSCTFEQFDLHRKPWPFKYNYFKTLRRMRILFTIYGYITIIKHECRGIIIGRRPLMGYCRILRYLIYFTLKTSQQHNNTGYL